MNRRASNAALTVVLLVACTPGDRSIDGLDLADFTNVLNVRGIPADARDRSVFAFADLGAWHAFGLPDLSHPSAWGGFTGPLLLMGGGVWLSRSVAQFVVEDAGAESPVDWAAATAPTLSYLPGRLHQSITADSITLELDLVFATARTAVLRARVRNQSARARSLRLGWRGSLLLDAVEVAVGNQAVTLTQQPSGAIVLLEWQPVSGDSTTSLETEATYQLATKPLPFLPGATTTRFLGVSAYFDHLELDVDAAQRDLILQQPEQWFQRGDDRWRGYISNALARANSSLRKPGYERVVVKAVQTLIANWRSPAGHLFHNGLFPSYAYPGFHGVWSWDSWKHARALANIDPELAKEQLRVMFDYQDRYGMIADVIYVDSMENNWRDTKLPLSAWAVRAIFERNGDTTFVAEMFPKLLSYHNWWYAHRDHDGNGLCEYGSTDGTRIAAAWESGMDNAVRFDEATMIQNGPTSWSLSQESVDLNAYLWAEKDHLAVLADALRQTDDAARLRAERDRVRQLVQTMMFDDETGYFYDIRLEDKQLLKVQGPEGWIPLWTGLATPAQASRVAEIMLDSTKFATPVPFPTLAADHSQFDPQDGYWRGTVWLDQAYFAVRGLQRYGFLEAARDLTYRLFEVPIGLLADGPIYENYHPLTGRGLNAPHFSWSAAYYLLLLETVPVAEP